MKYHWDVIRELLLEIEYESTSDSGSIEYSIYASDSMKAGQAFHLLQDGFIHGEGTLSWEGDALVAYGLTRDGQELLDGMRCKTVWEGIKVIAQETGVELTVKSIRRLGTASLKKVFACSTGAEYGFFEQTGQVLNQSSTPTNGVEQASDFSETYRTASKESHPANARRLENQKL